MKSPKISMKIDFHISRSQGIYLTGCGAVVLEVVDYGETVVFEGVELFEGEAVEGPVEGSFGDGG
jgi:hypothetical protein